MKTTFIFFALAALAACSNDTNTPSTSPVDSAPITATETSILEVAIEADEAVLEEGEVELEGEATEEVQPQ
jgi:hypothetical protein